jgi:hypothetical protein
MKKVLISLSIFSLVLASCSNDEENNDTTATETNSSDEKDPMNYEDIKRHIESQLKISPTEKYEIEVFEKHLDTDDEIDRLITVNLLDRAMKEAELDGKPEKRAALGYMGNYNFLFYVDGKSQLITSPIAVPSSPHAQLKVEFEHITSPTHLDFFVDFRIRRSVFRQFYTIRERIPIKVSESELFQNLGTVEQKDYFIVLEEVPGQLWKNIVVYEGKSPKKDIPELLDSYKYEPDVTTTDKLIRRWYYSPQHLKYYVRNDEL